MKLTWVSEFLKYLTWQYDIAWCSLLYLSLYQWELPYLFWAKRSFYFQTIKFKHCQLKLNILHSLITTVPTLKHKDYSIHSQIGIFRAAICHYITFCFNKAKASLNGSIFIQDQAANVLKTLCAKIYGWKWKNLTNSRSRGRPHLQDFWTRNYGSWCSNASCYSNLATIL